MANWNLGSVASAVLSRVENIPSSISGQLIPIADEERLFIEEYTGLSIGSTGIAPKYHGVLINLTIANALSVMNTFGIDAQNIRLGDFSVSTGTATNIMGAAEAYKKLAMDKLRAIGKRTKYYKTY